MLRHPIYAGLLAMYLGPFLVNGEWLGALALRIAVFAYARKVRFEEMKLGNAFGADYGLYRKQTQALLPDVF